MSRRIRVGIDVGGTFTHAVAIDNASYQLIAQVKVPTTHRAEEGVARGIIESLQILLDRGGISPQEVSFIAHSTTQATNALLEGDVAPVGILGLGSGLEGSRARTETRVGEIELAPGKFLSTCHRFQDTSKGLDRGTIAALIDELVAEGAQTIVAAGAFSVDDPSDEVQVMEIAAGKGFPATGSHEVSQLYGLKIRTRTAVVNASILPKMVQTARMTEDSVRKAGITAPLMIMRSDGGVMSAEEVRRRPILTILSGPAAGVAAALMYVRISDGIFLEVGGTSTDISVIRDGKALVKTAEVGGHRLFLRTLDVRTLGIAGGSMPRLSGNAIFDVGPRSAHIAGLPYSVFSPDTDLDRCELETLSPTPGDPADYLAVRSSSGQLYAVTPTCAANALGLVPNGDPAGGNSASAEIALSAIGQGTGKSSNIMATEILRVSSGKIIPTVKTLIEEYRLDKNMVALVGGGGGAAAIVPFTAKSLEMEHRLAENAAVISAIGVALAMVRDVIERTVINPSDQDILRIRREAQDAVVKLGASPDTVEVQIEIDPQKNILRAVATGATELRSRDLSESKTTPDEKKGIAAKSLSVSLEQVTLRGSTLSLDVFGASIEHKKFLGLMKSTANPIRVIDQEGVIRLQRANADVRCSPAGEAREIITQLVEHYTTYTDGGIRIPNLFLLAGARIVDFSGLANAEQLQALAGLELESLNAEEPVVMIISFG